MFRIDQSRGASSLISLLLVLGAIGCAAPLVPGQETLRIEPRATARGNDSPSQARDDRERPADSKAGEQPTSADSPAKADESSAPPPEKTEPPDEPAKVPVLSEEDVTRMMEASGADASATDELKGTAIDVLEQAQTELETASRRREETARNSQKILLAPETASELKAQLASPAEEPASAALTSDDPLDVLLSEQARLQPAIQTLKEELGRLEAEPSQRSKRRKEIVESQSTRNSRENALREKLALPPPAEEAEILTNARRALKQAQLQTLETESTAFQAELGRYDAEKAVDLIALQTQLTNRKLKQLVAEDERLSQLVAAKRRNDARYAQRQLQKFANGQEAESPYTYTGEGTLYAGVLTSVDDKAAAAETAALAQENVRKTNDLSATIRDVAAAKKQLEDLQETRARLLEKVARVGETGAIGLQLRKELSSLSNTRELDQRCRDRQETMQELEFTRIELDDGIREQQAAMDARSPGAASTGTIRFRLLFESLMTARAAEKTYSEYFNRLADLDAYEQELVREIEDFRSYIRTRVLWIRSNRAPSLADVKEAGGSLRELVSAANWQQLRQAVQDDLQNQLGLYVLLTALLVLLLFVQTRFRRTLGEVGDVASRRSCREFQPTARAAVLTLVISFPWPFVMGFFGWRVYATAPVASFAAAVGRGLLAASIWFLALNLLRQICKPRGLARAHFGWSDVAVPKLRSRLYGLILLMLPVIFCITTLHHFEYPAGRDALERCLFILGMMILTRFLYRVLHPGRGAFRSYIAANPAGWVKKLQWLWHVFAVGAPPILILLTALGYYYTAYELSWRLLATSWIVIGLLVVRGFCFRWFIVSHRRLRMEQTRQRLRAQAEAAAAEAGSEAAGATASPLARAQEESEELDEVSDQTERFIDSGLVITGFLLISFVCADVVQALDVLSEFRLWSTMVEVSVEQKDADGMVTIKTEPQLRPVTITNLLFAILFGCITYTAARNVPGLLQMILLQKLPLHPASRYAIRMVGRYLIVVVGVIVTFAQIGIGWAKVQWLAAALTVGLGFGLQEIFANFVSGMIILFERPVRIGDVVTIGDVTGIVSRIQIRATTITDWDRKEYIVPNKEFVTGRLLNWTLTDQTNRVVIQVGVAYGSDTSLARSLLLQAASDHPLVLEDPGPVATFESFGDSTLDLLLRCYLPDLDNRLSVITELHESIDDLFKKAQIEISFPQQDIYIRALPGDPESAA
ncbi:MAG: mechanosensitive ion channel [Planctomycetaceae bacterium]|nr:mechanosensitive ion channel [Planctomycetaceae bacterium]